MRWLRYLPLTALFLVVASVGAEAQPPTSLPYEPSTHCTSLSLFGGVATAESEPGALLGGSAGWQLSPRFSFEGNVMWLDRPNSETGFAAAFTAHVNLLRGKVVVPFLTGGLGFYHASVDASDDAAPKFYADRFNAEGDDVDTKRTFTDPSFVVGGGVDIFLSPQLTLRPQGDAMVVVGDGHSRVVPTFTLHLVYHFRDHPITPSRTTASARTAR
jgi:hypothetical protein